MDINFEYYKAFYYVAKYGNLTRAAAAMGGNQPNLSRMMKLLEAQLNCRLFIREARGVSLTEEGAKLYARVETACRQLLNAQEEISGQGTEGTGTVEIGATESALHLYLLEVLQDFKVRYPGIRMKVQNHNTLEILKYFGAGRLDFAMITTPCTVPKSFHCERVQDFREILVGGTKYGFLCGKKVRLDELSGCPWIGLGSGTVTCEFYRDFFARHGAELELDMEVATSDLLLPLIQNNLGIGFVPEKLAAPMLREKMLVQIPLACELPVRSIQFVSDRGRAKSRAADTFYRYLKERSEKKGFPQESRD